MGYRRNAYIKYTAGSPERIRPLRTTTTEGLIILKHLLLIKKWAGVIWFMGGLFCHGNETAGFIEDDNFLSN
jgi:hypothetical protein